MTRVAVMLRFETINGSISVYTESKYKQGQKDKIKVTRKNKDIKEVLGRDYLIFFKLV
jgi:indole-3-glycerol phosphate synthase